MKRFEMILGRHARRRLRRLVSAAVLSLAWSSHVAAQKSDVPVVVSIEVQGNQFLQRETLLYYISTKPGDRFDEQRLRDDFRRLWETGFLDDMLLDVRDVPQGKLVIFQVKERKRIQVVDFRGSKALTTTNIEDELKKKEAQLKIDSFYDMGKARRIESIIKDMLIEKGRPFATVKHDAKNIGAAGTQVSFVIDDGPRLKVKSIEFTGNQVFSDGKLRGQMKNIKGVGFWNLSWLNGKTKYTEAKWADGPESDKARLGDLYLDNGYVTAAIGEPILTYTDGKSGFLKKKPVKWVHLEIPVTEGEQYRVGQVAFEGLTVFREELIKPIFKLEPGEVYRESHVKKGLEKLRDAYGGQGYFQFTGVPQRRPDPEKKVVDVTLKMEEDKRYYVGKIRFTGNDSTRDKVIRREVYMNEGDVFNTEALKVSIRRVNQLGYFKPMEGAPDFNLSEGKDDHLDVTFKVEEQNRNQVTFGGGVSGLEGTFLNASFSTANFLGLGETLAVNLQTGRRTKNYQFSLSEPYLFDRPITGGFDLFKRKVIIQSYGAYVGYVDDRSGLGLVTGIQAGRFSRWFLNYSFEFIDIQQLPEEYRFTGDDQLIDQNAYGKRQESRLTPSFSHNTVDNPYTPRSGTRFVASSTVAGGPLGGSIDYFRPNLEYVRYLPHTKRTALGMRLDASYIQPFAATKDLPYYLLFRLGGEQQVRGYNIQAIGPSELQSVNGTNQVLLKGGNKSLLFNAEYYVDLFGPLRALLFFDAGQSYEDKESVDLGKLRISTGAEIRFMMPVLNVPFRLIYAWNPNRDPLDRYTERRTFKFAVGTTF